MPEEVLVVKKSEFPFLDQSGLNREVKYVTDLIRGAEFRNRDQMETDPNYKQLIPYSMLRREDRVFRYMRSAWGDEARLHRLYSIGIGGHINRSDCEHLWANRETAIEWARDRELREEFHLGATPNPQLIGILNDESNAVGRVHLGIVYEFWVRNEEVWPREKRNHIRHGFTPISDLYDSRQEYESWSRIIIEQHLVNPS